MSAISEINSDDSCPGCDRLSGSVDIDQEDPVGAVRGFVFACAFGLPAFLLLCLAAYALYRLVR